jgi:hypothetical protein
VSMEPGAETGTLNRILRLVLPSTMSLKPGFNFLSIMVSVERDAKETSLLYRKQGHTPRQDPDG